MTELTSSGTIRMTRGDTFRFRAVYENESGDAYEYRPGDKVTFTVRKKPKDPEILLQKVLQGSGAIKLDPEDTNGLEFKKTYSYDVQLNTEDGEVSTIGPYDLELLEENTY